MAETITHTLPHGITLHCRVAGMPGRPVLLFLHGFPEGAFIWDALLGHFADPAHGGYRCVAPWLRGYAPSSAPAAIEAYRPKHLVQDIAALIAQEAGAGTPLAALVAHDWGGAVAWNLANQHPGLLKRLMVINAPHPGAFLRELQSSAAQQEASAYMHFLCRPDAESLLAENDFARLFGFFRRADGSAPGWLTPALRAHYRAQWAAGLAGPCNYYRASPLRPPLPSSSQDDGTPDIRSLTLPADMLQVSVPTQVLWGMDDPALLPGLLQGLQAWVPRLQVQQVPGATHWVVHEQPGLVRDTLADLLRQEL
ncbi:MAG: alpha/beta hydrolase [Diaphorobacter nitroreducens]|uniref:Pimeloyl-ACP methyl ester carboxylesterase n=1 Tax=Diaphorobacter nitroreducens TaxID=164759 RepID=A0AAX1WYL6_9BURK|nr:alpha/beta hydrolase [Diaphorobacter sp. C33]ROR50672.1 pimeloyl-ACP methyl ester carboxylesterase [Diaphorobacter nitroreducens]WKK89594.1 alpha/beta hydrolase [Diaphorobacter sp. C33]